MPRAAPLLFLLLAACHRTAPVEPAAAPPGEVWLTPGAADEAGITTVPVEEREIGAVVVAARIALDDSHVSHVFSSLGGRVVAISAQLGQKVKKGEALATVDSPVSRASLRDLARAEAAKNAADHGYKRIKDLRARCVGDCDVEAAETAYRATRADLECARAKARLLTSGVSVGDGFVLRAPLDGVVLARNVSTGLEVSGMPTGGSVAPLFTIGDRASMWAIGDVHETDLARVHVGQNVTLRVPAHPDDTFEGTLDWVSGQVDPAIHAVKVRCSVPNPTRELQPDTYGTLTIATSEKSLAVPASSVVGRGEQAVVFVRAGEGPRGTLRFERRRVKVDDGVPGDWLPILEGVARGEQVVRSGANLHSSL